MTEIDARPDGETISDERKVRLGRIQFRAWRRGFREADMVLGPFADAVAPAMTDDELTAFEALLDQEDQYLYGWIIERDPTPAEFDGPVMEQVRAYMREHVAAHVGRGIG